MPTSNTGSDETPSKYRQPSCGMMMYASVASPTPPNVQNSEKRIKNMPRYVDGTNSVANVNATIEPPMPTPVMKRRKRSIPNVGENADARPKTPVKDAVMHTTGRLPSLSPSNLFLFLSNCVMHRNSVSVRKIPSYPITKTPIAMPNNTIEPSTPSELGSRSNSSFTAGARYVMIMTSIASVDQCSPHRTI